MASQRDLNFTKLIDRMASDLGNLVKWPDSEATKKEVELSTKALSKFIKADNYPDVIKYMVAVQIASGLFLEGVNRDVKFVNYKLAWNKIAELLE